MEKDRMLQTDQPPLGEEFKRATARVTPDVGERRLACDDFVTVVIDDQRVGPLPANPLIRLRLA